MVLCWEVSRHFPKRIRKKIKKRNFNQPCQLTLYDNGMASGNNIDLLPCLTKLSSPKCIAQILDWFVISVLKSTISNHFWMISGLNKEILWCEYFSPVLTCPGQPFTMQIWGILPISCIMKIIWKIVNNKRTVARRSKNLKKMRKIYFNLNKYFILLFRSFEWDLKLLELMRLSMLFFSMLSKIVEWF